MKRFKFWKWTFVVVWDWKHYHVSKNPIRRKKYPATGE
jgi:hypothetical protein